MQLKPVTPAPLAADTFTSTPSVPLLAASYQPLPATVSAAAVVMVIAGGATARKVNSLKNWFPKLSDRRS